MRFHSVSDMFNLPPLIDFELPLAISKVTFPQSSIIQFKKVKNFYNTEAQCICANKIIGVCSNERVFQFSVSFMPLIFWVCCCYCWFALPNFDSSVIYFESQ